MQFLFFLLALQTEALKLQQHSEFHNPPETASLLFGVKTGSQTYSTPPRDAWELKALMKAQLNTWGKNISREQFVIVGGDHDDAKEGYSSSPTTCDDLHFSGYNCKEATMLYRASERIKKSKSDWLIVAEEDKYVLVDQWKQILALHDPAVAQVVARHGCGKKMASVCEMGPTFSICGGDTYAFSRRALELIRATPEQTEQELIKEFTLKDVPGASDIASSCVLHKRGIPLVGGIATILLHEGTEAEQDQEISDSLKLREEVVSLHFTGTKAGKAHLADYVTKVHNHLMKSAA
jgi:hypothetical protein